MVKGLQTLFYINSTPRKQPKPLLNPTKGWGLFGYPYLEKPSHVRYPSRSRFCFLGCLLIEAEHNDKGYPYHSWVTGEPSIGAWTRKRNRRHKQVIFYSLLITTRVIVDHHVSQYGYRVRGPYPKALRIHV